MIAYCINIITAFHSSLGTATLFLSFFVRRLCFLEHGMGESLLVSLSVSSLDEDDKADTALVSFLCILEHL